MAFRSVRMKEGLGPPSHFGWMKAELLLSVLKEFFWSRGRKALGRNRRGLRHNLWMALGQN